MASEPKRVTLVADELLGYVRTGGIGTATTFLSLALARMGHEVELLYVGDRPGGARGGEWRDLYKAAGVRIRMLPRRHTTVEPRHFGRMRDVELALRAEPPDVVITQDLAAPTYVALRQRRLGLAYPQTLFVVYCHGTRQWITDMARKVRVLPGALAIGVLEQSSVELADVVVSPSAYLVDWMRQERWEVPADLHVIPYLTRSVATGEPPPRPVDVNGRVERLAFFGRLEERKGLKQFAAGLNQLDPELLRDIELEFLGRATPTWPPERIESLLSDDVRAAVRRITFETNADQPEALARLSRPGTLVVMPSLGETFSNAVYECLERRIPFVSSNAGAPPELIAKEDRERVLFEPTAEGVALALRRTLAGGEALRPAELAFDPRDAFGAWAEVIEKRPAQPARRSSPAVAVDVIVVSRPQGELERFLSSFRRQSFVGAHVVVVDQPGVEAARTKGLSEGDADWVVFCDADDVLDERFLETVVRAQSVSGADVVTCGLRIERDGDEMEHLFAGEGAALGALTNCYGTVALIRRGVLTGGTGRWPVEGDPDWPLLARLSSAGARIVSVPLPLVTRRASPGSLDRHPSDALLVAHELEGALPRSAASALRLAAGLAAEIGRRPTGTPRAALLSPARRAARRFLGR